MKQAIIIAFFLISTVSIAFAVEGTLELIIKPEYKSAVTLYNKPNGKIVASVKHDFEEEDYLTFSASNQTSDFFYGTLEYSISGKKLKGWVKKGKHIGTYARNYEPGKPLKLMSSASVDSKVNAIVPAWTNQFYQVTAFDKKWAYVNVLCKGQVKQGWLSPEMQCANPYTTCN
ncbi:hypothetical protein [Pontibacter flavimaris]|uniref:WG repeat-containing protein n=1 Tax=Pontibacter flavimaris TaxID=1797110 RepID=A0A1Q5PGL8_9BACT|nr:hypothetical protein [Pontibacter flavimaris]OKL41384.1 hypothetical protein A3841_10000 [Pontibacter flavimaris]